MINSMMNQKKSTQIECQDIRQNHVESMSTDPYHHDTQVSVTKLKDE